jgi:hypothetical protein
MEDKDEWVFYKEIEWDDKKYNQFNVDTRDFHCGYTQSPPHEDIKTLEKYPAFFYTKDELVSELDRLFEESGGEGEWRFLGLVSQDKRVQGWNLKYLRIYRHGDKFVVCNSYHEAIRKDILASPLIDKDLINHH